MAAGDCMMVFAHPTYVLEVKRLVVDSRQIWQPRLIGTSAFEKSHMLVCGIDSVPSVYMFNTEYVFQGRARRPDLAQVLLRREKLLARG